MTRVSQWRHGPQPHVEHECAAEFDFLECFDDRGEVHLAFAKGIVNLGRFEVAVAEVEMLDVLAELVDRVDVSVRQADREVGAVISDAERVRTDAIAELAEPVDIDAE